MERRLLPNESPGGSLGRVNLTGIEARALISIDDFSCVS